MTAPVAIIPARGGSKRLPRKNVLPFRGRPMIAWTIQAALDSGLFSRVICSTEDREIAAAAADAGAEVMERPIALADDRTRLDAVFAHVLAGLDVVPEDACLLMANCPLRSADDIAAAHQTHRMRGGDATISVVGYGWRPPQWALIGGASGWLEPVNGHGALRALGATERQVAPTGAIRWVRTGAFMADPTFYPARLAGHELPWPRAIDIDEAEDLEMAALVAHAMDTGFRFEIAA